MLEGIGRFKSARHGFYVVSLCQGRDGGGSFFAFVAIEPHNYNYFRKIYKTGQSQDFSVFGRELLRGPGTMPSDDIIKHISSRYNVQFGVGRNFIERMVAIASLPSNVSESSPFPLKPAEVSGSSKSS